MNALISLHNAVFDRIDRQGGWLLPTLARFTVLATLLIYYWHSATLKVGDGLLGVVQPSLGAYAQIFPRTMEAVGYDLSQLGLFHRAVVTAGTLAEFLLPALLLVGLATRLAAIGMIGFIVVQSLTDLYGHGGIDHLATLGAWFDRLPDGVVLDQRLFWITALTVLVVKGAGPLSLDRILTRHKASEM
ncbi:hypothetical protein [Aliiroseovarius sp.]|uniref:hypothetical protein n=1 Tax=Aliiroseovarius sp. TaxID=1872442 RepID=UPI0026017238|nr:hypothetical protein [Aliiroseovarius sp.]